MDMRDFRLEALKNIRACIDSLRRVGWITTNSACSSGSTIGLTINSPRPMSLTEMTLGKDRDPVGAGDEFERRDHARPFPA